MKKDTKTIEENLRKIFIKYGVEGKITVEDVKSYIYNSRGKAMSAVNRYNKHFFDYFIEAQKNLSADQLNEILQVFVEAWNNFSHKSLGGKSPEKMAEEIYGGPVEPPDLKSRQMPKVRVGNREMSWEDYEKMLKEMEKVQKPFKKWINKEALPRYKKYLFQTYKGSAADKHLEIAGFFFDRALHLGFVNMEAIHSLYVQKDFPIWFQTHVLGMNVKPDEIRVSLGMLFNFLELSYKIDKNRYGFK